MIRVHAGILAIRIEATVINAVILVQPFAEIDIGAPAGTEWLEFADGVLAADRAFH